MVAKWLCFLSAEAVGFTNGLFILAWGRAGRIWGVSTPGKSSRFSSSPSCPLLYSLSVIVLVLIPLPT
jgi:hypothetical protein